MTTLASNEHDTEPTCFNRRRFGFGS